MSWPGDTIPIAQPAAKRHDPARRKDIPPCASPSIASTTSPSTATTWRSPPPGTSACSAWIGRSSAGLKFGGQKLNLRPDSADAKEWFTAREPLAGTADLCFVTAVGAGNVVDHLRACGVTIELGPVERIGALGPMTSVYCRDPDGNLIEIATYLEE